MREVTVIGAPLDLGAGRRGVDMGPSAIRYAGLDQQLAEKLGVRVTDAGNVGSPVVETTSTGDERARYLSQILDLEGDPLLPRFPRQPWCHPSDGQHGSGWSCRRSCSWQSTSWTTRCPGSSAWVS